MKKRLVVSGLVAIIGIAFGAGMIVGASQLGKQWINPDVGLTEAERQAAHAQAAAAFWQRYGTWIREQAANNIDPRTYPVSPAMVSVAGPAPTLVEAVRQAELIIEGEVTGLTFRETADAVVRVNVTRSVFGNADGFVDVILPNALMPDEHWQVATIAEVEAMPTLYPGDRVTLFLVPDGNYKGLYDVQAWTGTYWHTDGRIISVVGNPFAPAIASSTPEAFRAAIDTALR